jgi:hypothetical protein
MWPSVWGDRYRPCERLDRRPPPESLERAAATGRDVNQVLVGGASTIVISTTTIIIILLIVILVAVL